MARSTPDPLSTLVSLTWDLTVFVYSRWRFSLWKRIANQYLQEAEVSFWAQGLMVKGRAGPLEVLVLGSPRKTQVVVAIPRPWNFTGVSIRHENYTPWKVQEHTIGSESFDRTFFIEGPARPVFALLDAETRNLLLHASGEISNRIELVRGEIVAEMSDSQLPRFLPLLLRIGEWLTQPVDVKQRLLQNATRDPEPGVRIKNLLVLAREFPGDPETREVLRTACSDPSPEVRLRMGRALGAEGLPVLMKLTEDLEDDTVGAEAVSMLSRELPSERIQDILRHALDRHCHQTALACMNALGRDPDASAVGVLVKVMEGGQEKLAVSAAQVLQKIGSPEAEGPLILALQREQPALRIAAANALARVGSPAAVLPLKEAAERFPRDPDLGQATRQAIAEIQLRLPGATPGQLSLAGAEAGQLSIAEAEAGQLSFATDQAGQLSISGAEDEPEKAEPVKITE
jgi:HEAT repeat protein